MFGVLRRIFKKSANKPQDPFRAGAYYQAQPRGESPVETARIGVESAAGNTSQMRKSTEPMVRLSYNAILKNLPRELHGKNSPSSSAKFFIPMAQVIEQLPTGTVKINFGELRQAAPAGIFRASSDQDVREVDLPLREILPQVTPNAFSRRSQTSLQVPNEITDLFGRKGEPLAKLRVLDKKELNKAEQPPPKPAPQSIPAEPPPTAQEAAPIPIQMPSFRPPGHPITAPKPPKAEVPKHAAPKPAPPKAATPKSPAPPVAPQPTPPSHAPFMAGSGLPEFLTMSLREICQQWPEAIVQEISEQSLEDAVCKLPLAQMGKVIRNGMVQLSWNQIRLWLQPLPTEPAQPGNGDLTLEIPLKLIASMTLSQSQPSFAQSKATAVDPAPAKPAHGKKAAKNSPAEPASAPGSVVQVPLSVVSKNWPARLQTELSAPKFAKTVIEVPRQAIEPGLKAGKILFQWQQILPWLKPAPAADLGSPDFETLCELPLPLLVPLLFPTQSASAPKRAHAADAIPDLFNAGGPIPEPAAPAEPPPVDEPPPAEKVQSKAPERPKEPKDLAELFGTPEKRNWTPNEIVHETTRLPEVQGALIALQDGLLVASCMPPAWKTETIAAFLPQIFGRMNQYAKELKMGELNSVTFTVEQGTLQIYNAGIIYFAALAHPGMPLPSCLNLIARELSRHTR